MGIHSVISPTICVKPPGVTRVLAADWSKYPQAANGESLASITSVAKSVLAGDSTDTLNISAAQIDDFITKASFSGGTDGQAYRIIWTVVWSGGEIEQHHDTLVIESGYK